jgi:molybdopterin-biosynthesis enzyme MoeA-like protein
VVCTNNFSVYSNSSWLLQIRYLLYTVEILCIGNELLSGITLNTNAHWISKKITNIGGFVRRVTVIRDDLDEINLTLTHSLRRKPKWIIICGGLGPTYDDKTLLGVGKTLKKGVKLNNSGVERGKKKLQPKTTKGEN